MKKFNLSFTLLVLLLSGINLNSQWVEVNNGMGLLTVNALAYSGNNLFAGTGNGVYLSTNNGELWTPTGLNNNTGVYSLASNTNTVFAGVYENGLGGIYKSTNFGANWVQTSYNSYLPYALAANGNNTFAGSVNQFHFSTDNGNIWTHWFSFGGQLEELAVNGSTIFAGIGSSNGVFLSTDNGINWVQTSLNNRSVYSIAVNGNNVFAGTYTNTGVYLSTNNGTTWVQTSLNNRTIYSLAINGNNVFAGTYQNSVYVSNDNGASWGQRNEGLGLRNVLSLTIFNNYIFAGTTAGGVYRRPLSELVSIQPISTEIPNQFSLSQNYPNPFNPSSKVKFQMSKLAEAKLVVFDILGREVVTLVNEELKPGTYEVDFDGTNYSSGVYYYKLTTGDFTETKKMILMK